MQPAEVDTLLFSMGVRQRFTQDTPILPEVWYAYAATPDQRHDLLITPLNTDSANRLLREILEAPGDTDLIATCPAALRGFVAMRLTFDEFCQLILPRTHWAKAAVALARRNDYREGWLHLVFERSRRLAVSESPRDKEMSDFEIGRIAVLIGAILADREALRTGPAKPRDGDFFSASFSNAEKLIARLSDTPATGAIWRVAMNRPLDLSDEQARSTVKADAAFRVFEVKCADICWAVIDSGIDAGHPAFNDGGTSRIAGAYDLTSLRPLLNAAYRTNPANNPQLARCCAAAGVTIDDGVQLLTAIYRALDTDTMDWSSIERLIRLQNPSLPTDGHGTHVAGIIGANWRDEDGEPIVIGLCPDIHLLDLRILAPASDEGETAEEDTEFAVISALQFVRYLNGRNEHIAVHGVNLSLSIPHAVENYACGRTPICDECERLVGAGVTVVAAAGNNGYQGFATAKGLYRGYATLSITDPGNADSVITVGSTHKREPHTFGVSYFSSRGPTGDGRLKPDLVAPGERIRSTLPGGEYGPLDGTSQATPHVSAAAAMLMARFPELIGQPRQIKQLLCESATDLGRERAFQGHGLLDTLRALQSY
ncbi:MAG: S8 family peptidase [Candidatus Sphingomonas phytovorans]|nr:S8 family peptidase [Sphingomonas sp.]WEK02347.1 MAG: S8 family peptidase [Sphingomonas sp.]